MPESTLNPEHSTLEAHLKRSAKVTAFISSVVSLLMAFLLIAGAYYKTEDTMITHGDKIEKIEAEIPIIKSSVEELKISTSVSSTEIKNIQKNIEAVDVKLDKVNDKLDKILMQTRN